MNNHQAQFQRMTQTPIPSLIISMSIPTIISMLVTALYNTADTFFVSQLNTSASGAVGVVFSLMAILQAMGFMFGNGGGSRISYLLGENKHRQACTISACAFYCALLAGTLIGVFGLLYVEELMHLLGATPSILPYAVDYGTYILLAAPIMTASFVLNNILRSEGKARFAMVGIATGGVLNILLDPIFIFDWGLGFGVAGAAMATAINQCISFLILLWPFLTGRTITSLSPRHLARIPRTYFSIMQLGAPSFCRQGLASLSGIALNNAAKLWGGDPAIAAMTIVSKLVMFFFCIILGFGQSYQPVVGYNYGARLYDRVRKALFFTLRIQLFTMLLSSFLLFTLAPTLIQQFIENDPAVLEIGVRALRAQCLTLPLIPLMIICNMSYQATGRAAGATFLACMRQGIFFLPLILLLPGVFGLGLLGVEITQAIADGLSVLASLPFLLRFLRDCKRLEVLSPKPFQPSSVPDDLSS